MVTTSSHPGSPEPAGGDVLFSGMTFNFDQENNPNARILLPSIRRSGYTLETALGDLIDNSLDAGADFIAVDLTRQVGDWTVVVADNGCGMDRAILDQMLR